MDSILKDVFVVICGKRAIAVECLVLGAFIGWYAHAFATRQTVDQPPPRRRWFARPLVFAFILLDVALLGFAQGWLAAGQQAPTAAATVPTKPPKATPQGVSGPPAPASTAQPAAPSAPAAPASPLGAVRAIAPQGWVRVGAFRKDGSNWRILNVTPEGIRAAPILPMQLARGSKGVVSGCEETEWDR